MSNKLVCTSCSFGEHNIEGIETCSCPCHQGFAELGSIKGDKGKVEPAFSSTIGSKDTNTFPEVTTKEISLYVKTIQHHGQVMVKHGIESDPLTNFMNSIGKISWESKEFQHFMYHCKQLLHLANRTTGLTNAYLVGVLIGVFLVKPELLPIVKEEESNENETEGETIQ